MEDVLSVTKVYLFCKHGIFVHVCKISPKNSLSICANGKMFFMPKTKRKRQSARKRLEDLATPAMLRLGRELAESGDVEILEREKGSVLAKVRGGVTRTVKLTKTATGFRTSCTCSKMAKFCKHCVAVAVASR